MGKHDCNYQIVYRGETLQKYEPGRWVFFQRPKEYGGGYWLGRIYDGVFMPVLERPASLSEEIIILNQLNEAASNFMTFDDKFKLI